MKNLNLLEKIGMIVGTVGAIMIILNLYYSESNFKEILALDQIVFWVGVLLWAFGNMKAQAAKKKQQETDKKID